jgi:hypothetical protein
MLNVWIIQPTWVLPGWRYSCRFGGFVLAIAVSYRCQTWG